MNNIILKRNKKRFALLTCILLVLCLMGCGTDEESGKQRSDSNGGGYDQTDIENMDEIGAVTPTIDNKDDFYGNYYFLDSSGRCVMSRVDKILEGETLSTGIGIGASDLKKSYTNKDYMSFYLAWEYDPHSSEYEREQSIEARRQIIHIIATIISMQLNQGEKRESQINGFEADLSKYIEAPAPDTYGSIISTDKGDVRVDVYLKDSDKKAIDKCINLREHINEGSSSHLDWWDINFYW